MAHDPPLYEQALSYPAQVDRRALLGSIWPGGGGAGGKPTAVANTMGVSIAPGWLAVPLVSGQGSAVCRWDAAEVVTLAAAPASGNQRWDLVVCQVRDPDLDGGANGDFVLTPVTGVPAAASPVVPATPPNAALISMHLITGGQANLNAATLWDRRPLGHVELSAGAAYTINAGWSGVQLNTVDAGAGWNPAFSTYTCPMPGRYLCTVVATADRVLTQFGLQVIRNGAAGKNGPMVGPGGVPNPALNLAAVIAGCAAGDTLAFQVFANVACNIGGASFPTWAAIQYLGPT